jgi:hypothetical protein
VLFGKVTYWHIGSSLDFPGGCHRSLLLGSIFQWILQREERRVLVAKVTEKEQLDPSSPISQKINKGF